MATDTSIVREAPEIEAYKLGLLESARNLSQQPMLLPAVETAGLSDLQQRAMSLGQQGIGAYVPYLQAGSLGVTAGQGLMGEAALATMSGTQPFSTEAAAYYMNPYQQQVTQNALEEMRRQSNIQAQVDAAKAVQAGAFGGTREGVQRAETARNLADVMSQRVFQDYAQNYQQAQQAYQNQMERQLQSGQLLGNLGTGLGSLGVQQAALGQAASQLGTQDIQNLTNLGAIEQQALQSQLDAARQTALQQTMAPYQQIGFLSDIYKGSPTTQMSLTQSTAPSTSPLQTALGLGVGALSAAAGAQKIGLFG